MAKQARSLFWLAGAAVVTSAWGAPGNSQGAGGQAAASPMGNHVSAEELAINQRFQTLDEYLAWLRKTAAPVDRPWYRETSPGVFELQTAGNLHLDVPGNEKRVFTRAELEKKFGFSK